VLRSEIYEHLLGLGLFKFIKSELDDTLAAALTSECLLR